MNLVQPSLEDLLTTPEARAAFEAKSAALEAAELIRGFRRRAVAADGTVGISQDELARRIGTSQARVSQIEKGEGRDGPSYALFRRIAYACGIDWAVMVRSIAEGAQIERELPFVVGVMADASGDATSPLRPMADRKFVLIDRDNFNDVMNPALKLKGANEISEAGGSMGVDLDDFEPTRVAQRVPALRALMETRAKLRDLMTKVARSEELEGLLEQVLKNENEVKALQDQIGLGKQDG
jgi:type VI secretion system protein ImpB